MPKLSTHRMNVVCLETFFQSPGMCVHSMYLCEASHILSNLLARMPACARPYMPLTTFKCK